MVVATNDSAVEGKEMTCQFGTLVTEDRATADRLNVLATPTHSGRKRKDFKRSQHHFIPRCSRRRLAGVRQLNRLANLAFLLEQAADKDADESGQVDFVDLVSSRTSVFAELLEYEEKMSMWNDFVDSSEEEQVRILEKASGRKKRSDSEGDDFVKVDSSDICEGGIIDQCKLRLTVSGQELDMNMDDKHSASSESAGARFRRISHNLRAFLRKRQFPHGELLGIEKELVSFFSDDPSSIYVAQLSDSFRRLLLHAVSQYLDLRAASFDVKGGIRQTQVENEGRFMPPATPLADYVEDLKKGISA